MITLKNTRPPWHFFTEITWS